MKRQNRKYAFGCPKGANRFELLGAKIVKFCQKDVYALSEK